MCWVMSTSATARSRVACSTESPSVQISTTSPVVAAPRLPQHDGPGEQAERQNDGHDGVKDAQLLEIEQAPPPRLHLALDGRVETAMLAQEAAERPHQRHVGHDVGHFAVDGRGLAGEIVMQRPAGRRAARNMITTMTPATRVRPAAIGKLTVNTKAIAATVAAQGGNTFQTNIFSPVNTALEVAVTRLVSVPGIRSAK